MEKQLSLHVNHCPPHLKKNLKEQLDALVTKGVVEKASSACPFSSPVVPVKKKNGQIRWAVDYRALNSISRKDHRPFPNVYMKLSTLKALSYCKNGNLHVFISFNVMKLGCHCNLRMVLIS